MASTSGSEFVVNSAAETSQNVDLVFVDEDEMPLTSVAIGTAYLERESERKLTQTFIRLTLRLKKVTKMKNYNKQVLPGSGDVQHRAKTMLWAILFG